MFYVDLFYTFKRIVGKANYFSDHAAVCMSGCNGFLFNCTTVSQADSLTARCKALIGGLVADAWL